MIYSRLKQSLFPVASLKKLSGDLLLAMDKGEEREPMIDFYVYRTGIYTQMSWIPNFTGEEGKFYNDEAKKWYEQIAEKWPLRTDFLITRVEDQIYKGNYEEAEQWLDLILSRTPEYGKAIWLNGVIDLVKSDNIEQALKNINSSIDLGYRWDIDNKSDIIFSIAPRIKPQNYALFIKFLENRLEKYDSSLDLVKDQITADSELRMERVKMTVNLLVELSLRLTNIDYNKIAGYLTMAVKYDAENPSYWSRLAAAYGKLRDKEGAIEAAQMAAQLNPGTYATDAAAFIYYIQNEQWDKLP